MSTTKRVLPSACAWKLTVPTTKRCWSLVWAVMVLVPASSQAWALAASPTLNKATAQTFMKGFDRA